VPDPKGIGFLYIQVKGYRQADLMELEKWSKKGHHKMVALSKIVVKWIS